jgi:DUF3096 family protein
LYVSALAPIPGRVHPYRTASRGKTPSSPSSREQRRAIIRTAISPSGSHPEGLERAMALNVIFLQPLIALAAGILILIIPRLLNYIVAIYLILVGLAGLLPQLSG